MRLLLLSLITILSFGGQAMATEEIAYTVIKSDGDIEIREYEETVVAEVTVDGTRKEAPSKAFRTLFKYISGENIAKQEIPMTAPVSQELKSQKIAMTAPVSQEQTDEGTWTIAFYMPNDMDFENTPLPKNDNVNIRKIPSKQKITIRFSGRSTDSNIAEHEAELKQYIVDNKIEVAGAPMYAFYNPPWTLWFMRRNEVLFDVK